MSECERPDLPISSTSRAGLSHPRSLPKIFRVLWKIQFFAPKSKPKETGELKGLISTVYSRAHVETCCRTRI
ncbi:hypothetical protein GRJ2_002972500 [Grus japonensis]|uniref:Uncharacterized protein n=1 Tax=Grus japonensis TaxID=30415 RepID=A0ABC9Y5T2_GRUJA